LSWDSQFFPLFNPGQFSADYLENQAQFDVGIGYTFERGKKRQHRLQAAKDQTAVTRSQVNDSERQRCIEENPVLGSPGNSVGDHLAACHYAEGYAVLEDMAEVMP